MSSELGPISVTEMGIQNSMVETDYQKKYI